jgi:hypothetical protein
MKLMVPAIFDRQAGLLQRWQQGRLPTALEVSGLPERLRLRFRFTIERLVAVKVRAFLVPVAYSLSLSLCAVSTLSATLITFDDIPSLQAPYPYVTNGYQGLNWTNFATLNAVLHDSVNGVSGASYGMVSPSNVAFNAFGYPAEISAIGTNFNFVSAYLTGAWNSNLNIEVKGFRGGALLYDQIVVASATNAILFTFGYLNIDRLAFNSFGGQGAGFSSSPGENFVMDNFTFEFVPEPSTFLLLSVGALLLKLFLEWKRSVDREV